MAPLQFDDRRRASLDGVWDFFPGEHRLDQLDRLAAAPISVPGLWEAQGYVDLDGVAWYRRRFELDDVSGCWSLHFGGVMDIADVFVNGAAVGGHVQAFTPFELDCTEALVRGPNELAVRVVDPAVGDPDHARSAHGKQGWARTAFPSPPSLYLTYGGIWQPVTLRRHGPLTVHDVFVEADPDDLVVSAHIVNRGPAGVARVGFRTLGMIRVREVAVAEGGEASARVSFGPTAAPRWRPEAPALHDVSIECGLGADVSDSAATRYGLRTVRVEGNRLLLDGEPYRMRSVLVQGFSAGPLYAEAGDAEIRAEVEAARAMGFNTLRLHVKAFDPRYLDACDEVGMLLHCDIPVAEPVAHGDMGPGSVLARRCTAAARAQVRRDRNHPSIVLWSAMNEIGEGRPDVRSGPAYEAFARSMFDAVRREDPTRPVIENDWVEPDPDRVFESPILTAHWYGRLDRRHLEGIEASAARWAASGRPLFVTEFGDWGLPALPVPGDPPFWDTWAVHAEALAGAGWPGSGARFAEGTQRYQGLSDRLQGEVFRRHDGVGGYCVTELTDVPAELNGLLDIHRRPKGPAVAELTRLNQTVLPMLRLPGLLVAAGEVVRADLHIANDGPTLPGVTVDVRLGDGPAFEAGVGDLPAHHAGRYGQVGVVAPGRPGDHDLVVRLHAGGEQVAENRYPIRVVGDGRAEVAVRLLGGGDGEAALAAVGVTLGDAGPVVVTEGGLDQATGEQTRALLEAGRVVLVLAQEPSAAPSYPVATSIEPLAGGWGSTAFRFTTDHGAVPTLPRRRVLVAEDANVHARSVVTAVDGQPLPDTPVVLAYRPGPGAMAGTVIGSHPVGAGRLVYCQLALAGPAVSCDAGARAILADLVRWISRLRPVLAAETLAMGDGRSLVSYSWPEGVAR